MTVLQPQSLEKKENKHKSSQAHIPTFWSLAYPFAKEKNFIPTELYGIPERWQVGGLQVAEV